MDQLKQRGKSSVIILAAVDENRKITLIAGTSPDCSETFPANELVLHVAKQIGGQGGGRKELAQGGGVEVENLEKALTSVYDWVDAQVSGIGWKDRKNVQ